MTVLTETKTIVDKEIADKNGMVLTAISIGENLHNRISRHINKLKSTEGPGQSKQKWVVEAIKEKLNTENLSEDIPREKILGLKISQDLHNQILKRVEIMRKVRNSFSKKQWLVEAISDKLDRDEKHTQKNLISLMH